MTCGSAPYLPTVNMIIIVNKHDKGTQTKKYQLTFSLPYMTEISVVICQ